MRTYPNVPMVFTDDEEGHDPQLLLFWVVQKDDNGIEKETGTRVLCTVCNGCAKPLKLYTYYNTIPWTF